MPLTRFHQRIQQKSSDRTAAPVLIVALGDSVTQGIGGINELYHDEVYHALIKKRLEAAHPLCTFSVINAGVDGDRVQDGLARLDRDVIRHQPDLVFVAFALNDAALGGMEKLPEFERMLEALCQRIRNETSADIVVITPNMMLTRDNDAIPARWRHVTKDFLYIQNSGVLASYAQTIDRVGKQLNILLADVYARWAELASHGTDTTAMLSNGLNHPNPKGHKLASDVIWIQISA